MTTYHACLIGNWRYDAPDGAMPALSGPEHDLAHLQRALEHPRFGLFTDQISVQDNLTDGELRTTLHEAMDATVPGDVLLIYYSGHGERMGNDQRLGLVGIDVPARHAKVRALDSHLLRDWLDDARATTKILILDCCYSGQFRGSLVDDELLKEFAEGTFVLSSGGNQVVTDAAAPDSPSPFTAALSRLLVDESLGGRDGFLSADDVYEALDKHVPRLPTPPRRNVTARGQFFLARRPQAASSPSAPPGRDAAAGPSPPPGWPERLEVTKVSVTFEHDHVVATWDQNRDGVVKHDERDVAAMDPSRLAAIRRISQLADAVMRAPNYRDATWQARARRALDTAAANLFHTAMPAGVRRLLEATTQEQHRLVQLDLDFRPPWDRLTDYPWEYLHLPPPAGEDRTDPVRSHLVVTRLGSSELDLNRQSAPEDVPDVAVVSSLHPPYDDLVIRLVEEIVAMPGLRAVHVPQPEPARWKDFMTAVDSKPHIMVLCAPLTRQDQKPRIGFDKAAKPETTPTTAAPADQTQAEPDWRALGSLTDQLNTLSGLRLVVLLTVAADVGIDAFRAAPAAASELSDRLKVPVVFVCHAPGLESYVRRLEGSEPQTLLGLILAAVSSNQDLTRSLWYARERVLRYIDDDLVPTLGIPGVIEPARPSTRHRALRSSEPRLRAARMAPHVKGRHDD